MLELNVAGAAAAIRNEADERVECLAGWFNAGKGVRDCKLLELGVEGAAAPARSDKYESVECLAEWRYAGAAALACELLELFKAGASAFSWEWLGCRLAKDMAEAIACERFEMRGWALLVKARQLARRRRGDEFLSAQYRCGGAQLRLVVSGLSWGGWGLL